MTRLATLLVGLLLAASVPSAQSTSLPHCMNRAVTVTPGTRAAEQIVGTPGNDVIHAGGGQDRVWGRGGNDRICGGRGADLLKGQRGNDRIAGGRGQDTCYGEWFHRSCETAILEN